MAPSNKRGELFVNEQYLPANVSLAMSYVPWQPYSELYSECVALERGTAFPALYLPFLAKEATVCTR